MRAVLFALIIISFSSTPIIAQIPTYKLAAWFPFSSNTIDSSGNGNNGILSGATLTTDRFGRANKAYSFNGTSDYIEIPSSISLSSDTISWSFWMKTDYVTTGGGFNINPAIIAKTAAGSFSQSCQGATLIETDGYLGTQVKMCTPDYVKLGTTTISDNQWKHIVLTLLPNSNFKVYINGVKQYTVSISSFQFAANSPIRIGRTTDTYWRAYKGAFDDLAIYNRILDSTEVLSLYHQDGYASNCVGINVLNPQRTLHVKDVIRLEPRTSSPDNPAEGDIYYDGTMKKLRVYDGFVWQNCW